MRVVSVFVALLIGLLACGPQPEDNDFEDDLEAEIDSNTVAITAAEASAVLTFLNGTNATADLLKGQVGITQRAATNIVAHVRGRDGRLGTSDDNKLDSVAELDRISYVGPVTIEKLRAYAERTGLIQGSGLLIEGVALTDEQGRAILACANGASLAELDGKAELDARAANAIIAARPIATLARLAAVAYVGKGAVERLRDFAPRWMPSAACTVSLDRRGSGDVAALNDILEQETGRDYPAWANLTTFQLAACLDYDSAEVQAEITTALRTASLGWAANTTPTAGGFVEGGVTFRDLLSDARQVLTDRGGPDVLDRHPELDMLVGRIRAAVEANPSAFREVLLQIENEECSETASAMIDTRNGEVVTIHRFPRC